MDIFRPPATSNPKDSPWERIEDIEAFIRSEVRARVAGSGDILVRGNPPHRDHSVAGSGKIKFR
jgi:hypothetical protein